MISLLKSWDSAFVFTSDEHNLNSNTSFIRSIRRTHNLVDFQMDAALHGHDFIEIAFVIEGTAIHQLTSKDKIIYSKSLSKGDVLFINPGDLHTYIFEPGEYMILENVIINPVALSNSYFSVYYTNETNSFFYQQRHLLLSSRVNQHYKLSDQELSQILEITEEMRNPQIVQSRYYSKLVELKMLELCYKLDEFLNANKEENAVSKDAGIHEAILFIQNNYTNKITIEDVSKVACCSRRQVERMYKYFTGETIINSINRLRIGRACFLLVNSNMNITAIALEVGIDNISYFNKIFKARMGVTPKEFRQNARNKQE